MTHIPYHSVPGKAGNALRMDSDLLDAVSRNRRTPMAIYGHVTSILGSLLPALWGTGYMAHR